MNQAPQRRSSSTREEIDKKKKYIYIQLGFKPTHFCIHVSPFLFKCRDSIASSLAPSPMTLPTSYLVVFSNIRGLSVYWKCLILRLWGLIFFVHIISVSVSLSTFLPLRSNMASLLVPHNTVLRHPLLLEHSFGCYLLPIVTENISFKEIQCSPQRKFWHGKQGESLSLLRRQAVLRMRWVLSREKKPAWVVTGRENSSG